ncbi:very short patch repair endonuclease [Sporosarcina jeotgali]|uniref:Very short patch repair endonuclease n=1 Tax=Sporosarcina jeotgali TaxID=3020056 RepID=A0ABZ0KTC7_9BACL|nr:very short patch repair endonuclease [Sporosarcina sp. B2O-1]WOV83664.1 very short patch repair endonuclease [Sporosarcina sp. B2O-1]
MADIMSKEQRSKTMSKIKAKSKLEDIFASALWRRGLRFRRNVRSLKGTPDIAIKKYRLVIFVDSCFWHVCPEHFKLPKTNQEFWDKKFKRNMERDREIDYYYKCKGWHVKHVWEHEIRSDLEKAVDDTVGFISRAKEE